MRSRRRNIAVFSISALDLFAAALGAFILIVLVLFPYYQLGGTDTSMEELEETARLAILTRGLDPRGLTPEQRAFLEEKHAH